MCAETGRFQVKEEGSLLFWGTEVLGPSLQASIWETKTGPGTLYGGVSSVKLPYLAVFACMAMFFFSGLLRKSPV